MGWLRYLFAWDRSPRIPHHLTNAYDITQISEDALIIMLAGKARDPDYAERLMRRYKAKNAVELLDRLPKPKRPSVLKRMHTLILRAEGSLPYDPIRRELHIIRREARSNVVPGVRRGRLIDRR